MLNHPLFSYLRFQLHSKAFVAKESDSFMTVRILSKLFNEIGRHVVSYSNLIGVKTRYVQLN